MFNFLALLVRWGTVTAPRLSNGLGWTCLGMAGAHFADEVLAIHAAAYFVILGYALEAVLEFKHYRREHKAVASTSVEKQFERADR